VLGLQCSREQLRQCHGELLDTGVRQSQCGWPPERILEIEANVTTITRDFARRQRRNVYLF
jgi:hypothetical protein